MDKENISLLHAIDHCLPGLIARNDKFPGFSRSEWVHGEEGKIYIRAGARALGSGNEGLVRVIDMATVELCEDFQGQGIWSAILERLEQHAATSGRALFVENVLSEKIDGALQRRGYTVKNKDEIPCSYWKRKEELGVVQSVDERRKPLSP